jgi:hypothetical protein
MFMFLDTNMNAEDAGNCVISITHGRNQITAGDLGVERLLQ